MAKLHRIEVLLLLMCGCFQQLLAIRTIESTEGVAFELSVVEDGLAKQRRYELLDLMVTKLQCQSDCTLWSIVRAPGAGSVYLTGPRVAYGQQLPGTSVRTPAGSLMPGSYAVSATLQEHGSEGEVPRSLVLDSKFEIGRETSGKLRVVNKAAETGGCK